MVSAIGDRRTSSGPMNYQGETAFQGETLGNFRGPGMRLDAPSLGF
jgi:hypothetical protein